MAHPLCQTLVFFIHTIRNPAAARAIEELVVKHETEIPEGHDAIIEAWQEMACRIGYNPTAFLAYVRKQKQEAEAKKQAKEQTAARTRSVFDVFKNAVADGARRREAEKQMREAHSQARLLAEDDHWLR